MAEKSTRSIDELERDIEVARQDLVVTFEELGVAVRERLEWRTWVRRRPLASVGLTFALGLFIGLR